MLTLNDGILYRTKQFRPDYRYTSNFVDAWSIDEVIAVDVTRPGAGTRNSFYDAIADLARRCFVPLSCGGGVGTISEVRTLLEMGADKVVINTAAVRSPELITEVATLYGSQLVVVSIDARKVGDGTYEVMIDQGTTPTGLAPEEWARRAEELGAGEIMVTSIERDGSLEGYDNVLNRRVADAVGIPVLVAGGAGKWQDFVDGFEKGAASAVCTTNIYHFTESSIRSAKLYLLQAGIPVRV